MDFGHVTPPRCGRTRTHSLAATATLTYNRELTQRKYIPPANHLPIIKQTNNTRSIFHGRLLFPKLNQKQYGDKPRNQYSKKNPSEGNSLLVSSSRTLSFLRSYCLPIPPIS